MWPPTVIKHQLTYRYLYCSEKAFVSVFLLINFCGNFISYRTRGRWDRREQTRASHRTTTISVPRCQTCIAPQSWEMWCSEVGGPTITTPLHTNVPPLSVGHGRTGFSVILADNAVCAFFPSSVSVFSCSIHLTDLCETIYWVDRIAVGQAMVSRHQFVSTDDAIHESGYHDHACLDICKID